MNRKTLNRRIDAIEREAGLSEALVPEWAEPFDWGCAELVACFEARQHDREAARHRDYVETFAARAQMDRRYAGWLREKGGPPRFEDVLDQLDGRS